MTIADVRELLTASNYSVGVLVTPAGEITTFENDTIIGFVLHYTDVEAMLEKWRNDSGDILIAAQLALRRSTLKAWNVYFLILSAAPCDYGQMISIGAIEEDLVGTRKIARAGIASPEQLRFAILPLLEIQNAPQLEAVDMSQEIRFRTTEIPENIIDVFLSDASDATLLQILESS